MTNTTQAAATVRASIKAAVKSGALPAAKYSVRTRYASLMSAIDITVTDVPFCAWEIDGYHGGRRVIVTAAAKAIEIAIHAMVRDAGYIASNQHSFVNVNIDIEERSALFTFIEAERSGEIARAA